MPYFKDEKSETGKLHGLSETIQPCFQHGPGIKTAQKPLLSTTLLYLPPPDAAWAPGGSQYTIAVSLCSLSCTGRQRPSAHHSW